MDTSGQICTGTTKPTVMRPTSKGPHRNRFGFNKLVIKQTNPNGQWVSPKRLFFTEKKELYICVVKWIWLNLDSYAGRRQNPLNSHISQINLVHLRLS